MEITKRQLRRIIKEAAVTAGTPFSSEVRDAEADLQFALETFIDVYDKSLGGVGPVSAIHSKLSDIVARTIDMYEEASSFGASKDELAAMGLPWENIK